MILCIIFRGKSSYRNKENPTSMASSYRTRGWSWPEIHFYLLPHSLGGWHLVLVGANVDILILLVFVPLSLNFKFRRSCLSIFLAPSWLAISSRPRHSSHGTRRTDRCQGKPPTPYILLMDATSLSMQNKATDYTCILNSTGTITSPNNQLWLANQQVIYGTSWTAASVG